MIVHEFVCGLFAWRAGPGGALTWGAPVHGGLGQVGLQRGELLCMAGWARWSFNVGSYCAWRAGSGGALKWGATVHGGLTQVEL
jgi:hypothetical protein